jgi:hypothetical protein
MIQNAFTQKAVEDMLRKHMGITVLREKKVPRLCIENAKIRNTSGLNCIPSTAIKKGMLTARSLIKGITKTALQTQLFIKGNSIPFTFEREIPRMDMVRVGGMGAKIPDVRFRPEFQDWKARLVVLYSDAFKVQTVVDLLNRAGEVGVGEWRPEKSGTFGTYEVVRHIGDKEELDEVIALCEPPLVPLVIPDWAMDAEIDEKLLRKIAGGTHDGDDEDDKPGNVLKSGVVAEEDMDKEAEEAEAEDEEAAS